MNKGVYLIILFIIFALSLIIMSDMPTWLRESELSLILFVLWFIGFGAGFVTIIVKKD